MKYRIVLIVILAAIALTGCVRSYCGDGICDATESCAQDCDPSVDDLSLSVQTTQERFAVGEQVLLSGTPTIEPARPGERLDPRVELLINQTMDHYGIELDMPSYQPEELRHPQHFLPGRTIRIVKKEGYWDVPVKTVALTGQGRSVTLDVKKTRAKYIAVTLPTDLEQGTYVLDFSAGDMQFGLPILVSEAVNAPTMAPSGAMQTNVKRLGCSSCYWESVLAHNPSDPNIGYFIGSYNTSLVTTNDGWQTHTQGDVDAQTINPQKHYRGDAKFAFTPDDRLVLASLFWKENEPITGGIYTATGKYPLQFEQTILKQPVPGLDNSQYWILFDYEKVAVDRDPASPYYGSIYVTSNANYFEDTREYGTGFYIIRNGAFRELKAESVGFYGPPPNIAAGPGGAIYLANLDADGTIIYVSEDGGASFAKRTIRRVYEGGQFMCWGARVATTSNRAWLLFRGPSLAIDESADRVYAAWAEPKRCVENDPSFEYGYYGDDHDIFLSYSDDHGRSWSSPVRVDDDESGGDQGFPSIGVAKDGTIYVAFLDHRDRQDLGQFDVYLAQSRDGGKTFSRNLKVNDLSVSNMYGGREPGDYLDMVAVTDEHVFVAHPCADPAYLNPYSPSDACIAKLPRPLNLPVNIACADGQDNDGDGLIDLADPGCISLDDRDERTPVKDSVLYNNGLAMSGTLELSLERLQDGGWQHHSSVAGRSLYLPSGWTADISQTWNEADLRISQPGMYRVRAVFKTESSSVEQRYQFVVN